MTLDEAIAEVEGWFQVHAEIGAPTEYTDSNGGFVQDGPRDLSLAPNGEPYIRVTSAGILTDWPSGGVFFGTEARAVTWWLYAIEDYAESIAPKDEWKNLHLYWRTRPIFETADYVATNQAELLQRQHGLDMMVTLGVIYSRVLISKLNPEGKED